jgi:hypothetical protein
MIRKILSKIAAGSVLFTLSLPDPRLSHQPASHICTVADFGDVTILKKSRDINFVCYVWLPIVLGFTFHPFIAITLGNYASKLVPARIWKT